MVSDDVRTCTVTDRCKNPAVVQTNVDCTGCSTTDNEVAGRLETKRILAERYQHTIDYVREHAEPTDAIAHVAMQLGQAALDKALEELAALTAHYETVRGGHTHPMFICDTHLKRKV